MAAHLVETSNQNPELFIVNATDKWLWDIICRFIPAQILDFGSMVQLSEALLFRLSLGKGMTGCGFFSETRCRLYFSRDSAISIVGHRHQVLEDKASAVRVRHGVVSAI